MAELCPPIRGVGQGRIKHHVDGLAGRAHNRNGAKDMRQASAGRDWTAKTATTASLLNTQKSEQPAMNASDSSQGQLWNRVRARIKASVGEDVFTSWFARLDLEEIRDGVVHLS